MMLCIRYLCFKHIRRLSHQFPKLTIFRAFSTDVDQSKEKQGIYEHVLHSFPGGIQMAFAYGSGVFQQTGHEMSKNMLDFIFVVDDPAQWHKENLCKHRHHYSFLSALGASKLACYQEKVGAGVYFNTLVQFDQRLIKYGVISTNRLIRDLTDWDSLYISGRLHKPVRIVQQPSCKDLSSAMRTNLNSAVHAALLLLPEKFTEEDFFVKITSLSYSGDFRMKFGEDKGKVRKIVTPNLPYFYDLYSPFLENEKTLRWNRSKGTLEQSVNSDSRLHHLKQLPKNVTCGLQNYVSHDNKGDNCTDLDEILQIVSKREDCPMLVAASLENIVGRSSWRQSLKGIWTAGVTKSVQYSLSKVKKMFKSMNFKTKS